MCVSMCVCVCVRVLMECKVCLLFLSCYENKYVENVL